MEIAIFVVVHSTLSIFCQTFFLHRYAAHKMFTMSHGWERFFHLLTYIAQGASYLNPRGYAIMHREHHAFSDTDKDPHSPLNSSDAMTMMLKTKHHYDGYAYKRVEPESRFDGDTPEWEFLDRLGQNWVARISWGVIYTAFYLQFATETWMFFLLPIHYLIGPIHGAIVNWCGHKYGYRNFDLQDVSRNTLIFDFITLGELFQNNHHKYPTRANFGVKWYEIDPTYPVILLLDAVGIIRLQRQPRAVASAT